MYISFLKTRITRILCRAASLPICVGATILGVAEAREYSCALMENHRAIIEVDQAPTLSFSYIANPVVVTSAEEQAEGIALEGYVLSEDAVDMNARRARLCGTAEGRRIIENDGSAMPCGFTRMERYQVKMLIQHDRQRALLELPDGFERSLFKKPEEFDLFRHAPKRTMLECASLDPS